MHTCWVFSRPTPSMPHSLQWQGRARITNTEPLLAVNMAIIGWHTNRKLLKTRSEANKHGYTAEGLQHYRLLKLQSTVVQYTNFVFNAKNCSKERGKFTCENDNCRTMKHNWKAHGLKYLLTNQVFFTTQQILGKIIQLFQQIVRMPSKRK